MRVRVYANLRELVNGKTIELDLRRETDVRSVLRELGAAHPALDAKLWDADNRLSKSVQVLVNGRPIAFLNGLETAVAPQDTVDLFPPVGGG